MLQSPRMTMRTGGRLLVDQLKIQGCDRIFTVPGESFLAVLDALHDVPQIDVAASGQWLPSRFRNHPTPPPVSHQP